MIHGLLGVKLGHGWHDTKGIASEEDNVLRVTSDSWQLNVPDVLEGVADTSVWRQADVVIVDDALLAFFFEVAGILDDRAKLDSVENIWLLRAGKSIGLGLAATLDVEHVLIRPDVLIITDKKTLRVR